MKYKIIIEETISQEFFKEASNINEAKEKAIKDYKSGQLVLDSGEVEQKQIKVIAENPEEIIEWEKF